MSSYLRRKAEKDLLMVSVLQDSNPQPLKHESSPITTRPGLSAITKRLTDGFGSPCTMHDRCASLPTPEWTFSASTSISGSSAKTELERMVKKWSKTSLKMFKLIKNGQNILNMVEI